MLTPEEKEELKEYFTERLEVKLMENNTYDFSLKPSEVRYLLSLLNKEQPDEGRVMIQIGQMKVSCPDEDSEFVFNINGRKECLNKEEAEELMYFLWGHIVIMNNL